MVIVKSFETNSHNIESIVEQEFHTVRWQIGHGFMFVFRDTLNNKINCVSTDELSSIKHVVDYLNEYYEKNVWDDLLVIYRLTINFSNAELREEYNYICKKSRYIPMGLVHKIPHGKVVGV